MIGAWVTPATCASRNQTACVGIARDPLNGAGRAFGLHPVKAEQVVEILAGEGDRVGRPCAFQAAADGILRIALSQLFFQPRPCCSIGAAVGSGPTQFFGAWAPCAFPKVCPPAIRATVSSSSIAMRAKVSRVSLAAAKGSGVPHSALRD